MLRKSLNFNLVKEGKEGNKWWLWFKRDKNLGILFVKSSLKTDEQPGSFKCSRARCNTCSFIHNTVNIAGPKRSIEITDRFDCISANVIYCITCTRCKMLYIGETGRGLGDRFREHLIDRVKNNDRDASKPVSKHFNLPGHYFENIVVCGLSLHQGVRLQNTNLSFKSAPRNSLRRLIYLHQLRVDNQLST